MMMMMMMGGGGDASGGEGSHALLPLREADRVDGVGGRRRGGASAVGGVFKKGQRDTLMSWPPLSV